MTERKTYELTDDSVQRLISYARASGSTASHLAADELVPVGGGARERMYTREDMARAWGEGHEDGIAYARLYAVLDGKVPSIDNPYHEQEEA